jgi:hypothetical protein
VILSKSREQGHVQFRRVTTSLCSYHRRKYRGRDTPQLRHVPSRQKPAGTTSYVILAGQQNRRVPRRMPGQRVSEQRSSGELGHRVLAAPLQTPEQSNLPFTERTAQYFVVLCRAYNARGELRKTLAERNRPLTAGGSLHRLERAPESKINKKRGNFDRSRAGTSIR